MRKTLTLAAGLLAYAAVWAVPVSEDTAISLSAGSTDKPVDVSLYESRYTIAGETNTEYLCYYKMTLSKGKQYTLWLTEETPNSAAISISSAYAATSWDLEVTEPGAIFTKETHGSQARWVFTGEDWDGWSTDSGSDSGWGDDAWGDDDWGDDFGDDDWEWDDPKPPSSWTYYIVVRGNEGAVAKLHCMSGIQVPQGTTSNPTVITMKTAVQTNTLDFIASEYYVSVKLEANRRYYVGVTGGKESAQLSFNGLPKLAIESYLPWYEEYGDAKVFVTDEAMTCKFKVTGANAELEPVTPGGGVKLFYRVDEVRTLAQHDKTPVTVGATVVCTPGYENAPATGAFDDIIDEQLYSFKAVKGKSYRIETSGAEECLKMALYDSKGKVIASNTSKGLGSFDVRVTLESAAAGTYYVGVCEDLNVLEPSEPTRKPVDLTISEVAFTGNDVSLAEPIVLHAAIAGASPYDSSAVVETEELDGDQWYRIYSFEGRKGLTYEFGQDTMDKEVYEGRALRFEVFYLNGKTEKAVADLVIAPQNQLSNFFYSDRDATYFVRVSVNAGVGTDYPPYKVHAIAYDAEGGSVGQLKVSAQGASEAKWTLKAEDVKNAQSVTYMNGTTVVLPVGKYQITYGTVKGFSAPSKRSVEVVADKLTTVDTDYYSDTSDHKDDVAKSATSWTLKATETTFARTLWPDDPADHFCFDGKDGCYYTFELRDVTGDATFSVTNASGFRTAKGLTSLSKHLLPKQKTKYYLVVEHGRNPIVGGSYTLAGYMKNVGSIKFSSTSLSAKDTATSVKLTVNRTAKEGEVRVKYATADGSAVAVEHYVAQEGELVWANNDNKAKTIEIKLIPKLIAAYNGGDKRFFVTLEDAKGEYPADIVADTATVTIKESSKESVTVASVYAKKAPKLATVKTETGALRGGTFYGIALEQNGALTNGLPEYAAITLTVSAKGALDDLSKDSISAKVALAGKTYTFKTAGKEKAWNEEDPEASPKTKTLSLVQKVGGVSCTNTLELSVFDGETTDAELWRKALATAKLTMNVPDANNKGVQKDIVYQGSLYRQNAKIQAYLNAVTNFTGYYTVALANSNSDAAAAPAGNGYLTLTVDNKGTAKVAGLLADSTKLSFSVTASFVRDDGTGGNELVVPLYAAKSPYCFGGEIVLKAVATGEEHPDGKTFDIVVRAADGALGWNNDNAKLTYDGNEGWSLDVYPVGGWYDTVFNLQNYYKEYAFSVSTADIAEFPKEALADGYEYVTGTGNEPNGYKLDLAGDAFNVAKKSLVKDEFDKTRTDLSASTNPYNVQLTLARATGIVTGSFSLWSDNGTKQKEITGIKHYGILVQQRGAETVLPADVLTAGFFTQTVKVADGKKTRSWTMSKPFNVRAAKVAELQ